MSETRGPWSRSVTQPMAAQPGMAGAGYVQRTEYLDERAAAERLWEAMRERPDAGVSGWLDIALNGWGDA